MKLVSERKIRQTEYARGRLTGYAYAALTTPDDAKLMIVKMMPQVMELIE